MSKKTPTATRHSAVDITTKLFKQQLPRNLYMQVLSFILHVGIGIWLTPYLIHRLGSAAYGLIPIAAIMTQYVSLVSRHISTAVSRFLTIALHQNDIKEANCIFNTAFFSYLVIGLIQIPIFGLIIYNANSILSIPKELYHDAIILLVCSTVSFLINLVLSVFSVPIFAYNRLDISRSIDISRMIARLIGIILLFVCLGPRLRYIGYLDLFLTIVVCTIQIGIGKRLAPILKLAIHCYDWHKVRELLGMSCWLIVSQIGSLLFFRTDVWICNRFVDAESAGEYAAILQWPMLIQGAGSLIATVIAPMTVIYYARLEIDNVYRMNRVSIRLLSLALAIPISMISVFSTFLLRVWLGDTYVHLAPLMVILLCPLVIHVGVSPVLNIFTATNKVRWPGIATLIGGATNMFLAILFTKYFGWDLYGVAIASLISRTSRNIFLAIYACIILKQSWYIFIKSSLSGLIFLVALILSGYTINQYVCPTNWLQIVLICLAIGTTGSVMVWIALTPQERRTITDCIPSPFKNITFTRTHS